LERLTQIIDAEVIPYQDESTLCVICKQRLDIEQQGDELVFKNARAVSTGEGKSGVIHAMCAQVDREEAKSDEGRQKAPLDTEKLREVISGFEQQKRQRTS
jgi:formaldehyde-activating enzyme involved in methanogenesis